MKVKDIVAAIEEFAPCGFQEKWDNSGLCIGSMEDDVHKVLLGLDCTPSLVDEAAACGADMIVTHHPLIFSPLRTLHPQDPVSLAVMKAVKASIAVYAAHTSADKVPGGVSWAMARRLGLENIRILDPETPQSGLGAIGELPREMKAEEFIGFVKKTFSLKAFRCSKPVDIPVKTVAMCGGSGSSLIDKAAKQGAQAYLCADVSYHHFFTPEGFMIMDIGHWESEVEIVDILFSVLTKKLPTFAVRISADCQHSNPVYYY